jgi:hypothetical protein
MKTSFKLLILMLALQTVAIAQDAEPCIITPEVQSFPLIEDQITFRSDQMDLVSIAVVLCSETDTKLILPKLIISEDETFMVINFEGCNIGTYLISGSRSGLTLTYVIEVK